MSDTSTFVHHLAVNAGDHNFPLCGGLRQRDVDRTIQPGVVS